MCPPRLLARLFASSLALVVVSTLLAPAAGAEEGDATAAARRAQAERVAEQLRGGETAVLTPREEPRWRGELISLSLRDADLVEVLRSFARLAGVDLVVDPAVSGTVTVELEDVPWDQALYVILKSQGLGMEIDGRLWGVGRDR